ncbi:MAG: SIS domain-containing protein [Candidatus Woesearchaeota archaeon]
MIITKTPLRISFAGGGTDIADFYRKHQGAVVSTSINKYVYIVLHNYFYNKIFLKYSKTELVSTPERIKHPIIRECFLKAGVKSGVELASFADIPSSGTGLGSSSAFTVGLLKALYMHQSTPKTNLELAEEACDVEIKRLKEPIGKQDQYACAIGGLNLLTFNKDGSVGVEPIYLPKQTLHELQENLVLLFTGITRKARTVLSKQKKEMKKKEKIETMLKMRDLAFTLRDELKSGNINSMGEILHKNWLLKKSLSEGISNKKIDAYYEKALEAGATGGKILGAGGGGFLLFYCPKEKQELLVKKLGLERMHFRFEHFGSRIVHLRTHEMDTLDQIYETSESIHEFSQKYSGYLAETFSKINHEVVEQVIKEFLNAERMGKTIYFIGNGGSAAIATHFACDIGKGTKKANKMFKAISLADNLSTFTAYANDLGYEHVFSKQLENVLNKDDILVSISSSGNSPNIINAVEYAKKVGAKTISFVGFDGGKLKEISDITLWIPTEHGEYEIVEDIHEIIHHLVEAFINRVEGNKNKKRKNRDNRF